MSIRVLDPRGRPLRPVSPKKAAGMVERGRARWLHAPGVDPDRDHGTVCVLHPVEPEPERRRLAQVFDADGVFLACLDRFALRYSIAASRVDALVVGDSAEYNAVMLAAPATREVKAEIRRVRARQAGVAALERERIRDALLAAVRPCDRAASDDEAVLRWRQAEEAIQALAAMRALSRGAEALALRELDRLRRQVGRLDLAIAADMAEVAAALARGLAEERPRGGVTRG